MSEKEYVHDQLDNEVNAIGGRYTLTEEIKLPFKEKVVLYLTGHAHFDSTCCGAGGCSYAVVQGFIHKWKEKKNDEGYDISRIEPITDRDIRAEIQRLIMKDALIGQVVFVS